MNRRTFFKRVGGAIAGGIVALVLGKQKKASAVKPDNVKVEKTAVDNCCSPKWQSMTMTYDTTSGAKFYIDGELCKTISSFEMVTGNPPNSEQITVYGYYS